MSLRMRRTFVVVGIIASLCCIALWPLRYAHADSGATTETASAESAMSAESGAAASAESAESGAAASAESANAGAAAAAATPATSATIDELAEACTVRNLLEGSTYASYSQIDYVNGYVTYQLFYLDENGVCTQQTLWNDEFSLSQDDWNLNMDEEGFKMDISAFEDPYFGVSDYSLFPTATAQTRTVDEAGDITYASETDVDANMVDAYSTMWPMEVGDTISNEVVFDAGASTPKRYEFSLESSDGTITPLATGVLRLEDEATPFPLASQVESMESHLVTVHLEDGTQRTVSVPEAASVSFEIPEGHELYLDADKIEPLKEAPGILTEDLEVWCDGATATVGSSASVASSASAAASANTSVASSASAAVATGKAAGKTTIDVENEVPVVGPYSQMLRANGFIFCSAQVGFVPETGKLVEGDITAQTKQLLDNFEAELAGAGASMDDIVKVTVYLTNMDDFAAMNAEYAKHFSEPYPVRACVQVVTLPVEGALVSIDIIAIDPSAE